MRAWPTVGLGELASFRNGLNYTDANNGAGLAVIGVSDFQDRAIADLTTLSQLSMSALSTPDALVKKDDILFVRSNGNRELIGRSLFVKTEPEIATSHSGFTIRCRFADARCEPRFFAYLFRGHLIRQTLSAQGGGTNISNLNQGILCNLQVPLPPLLEQRRIATVLSAYDDLIETNTRRIAILEEMARRIFDEWFVHFRAPGYEGPPLVESELGPIPKGWSIGPLDKLARLQTSTLDPRRLPEEIFAHYSYPAFDTQRAPVFEPGSEIMSNKFEFQAPCILLGKLNPRIKRVWYVQTRSAFRSITSTEFLPLQAQISGGLPHLLGLLRSDYFADQLGSLTGGTSTSHQRANPKNVMALPTIIPPVKLVQQFSSVVGGHANFAEKLRAVNRNLRAQRDLLLPKLVSGEIDVTEAATLPQAAE